MKIVDNTTVKQSEQKPLENGDIIIGIHSGNYYLVIENGETGLNLSTLRTSKISMMLYDRTNLAHENITLTLEGVK